ncbi:hypothetical protein BJ912DRAFT_1069398 [Pholiota molesta]|nr:hypothetical protein BJ912DRAFT_1069398 [Pholiota molesta]
MYSGRLDFEFGPPRPVVSWDPTAVHSRSVSPLLPQHNHRTRPKSLSQPLLNSTSATPSTSGVPLEDADPHPQVQQCSEMTTRRKRSAVKTLSSSSGTRSIMNAEGLAEIITESRAFLAPAANIHMLNKWFHSRQLICAGLAQHLMGQLRDAYLAQDSLEFLPKSSRDAAIPHKHRSTSDLVSNPSTTKRLYPRKTCRLLGRKREALRGVVINLRLEATNSQPDINQILRPCPAQDCAPRFNLPSLSPTVMATVMGAQCRLADTGRRFDSLSESGRGSACQQAYTLPLRVPGAIRTPFSDANAAWRC